MKFTSSLSAILISASALLSFAAAGRSKASNIGDLTAEFFSDRHYEKIARQKNKFATNDAGYQILPPKASPAQCNLALQRISQQPRSCAEQYMARTARNVYLPIYLWFESDQLTQTAAQFSLDNGVAVEVSDAFGNILVETTSTGTIVNATFPIAPNNVEFDEARTYALNYPTFLRDENEEVGKIQQIVFNDDAEMLLVEIMVPLNQLPVVC